MKGALRESVTKLTIACFQTLAESFFKDQKKFLIVNAGADAPDHPQGKGANRGNILRF